MIIAPSILGGSLIGCYSSFADSAWVQTNFPRGALVQRPNFVA